MSELETSPLLAPSAVSSLRSRRRLLLYVEVFLSSFGERLWGFAVPILLATMYPANMWPAASVALVETLGGFLSGPFVGAQIDRGNKFRVMQVALVIQNVSIVLVSGCFYAMVWLDLASPTSIPSGRWTFWALMSGIIVVTAVNSAALLARTVSLQKVWVPAVCDHDSTELISTNAILRRINLVCEIGAPLGFGVLLSFLPASRALDVSIYVVVGWNLASFIPEMVVLNAIFKRTSSLSTPSDIQKVKKNALVEALQGVSSYAKHGVFVASLSYAFLFVTVLMPGVLMTSYLLDSDVRQWEIAVFRGLCAVTGILATLIAAPLMRKVGTVRAGVIFSWFQWGFLVPATGAAFLPLFGFRWGVYVFMGMVILSRMGLWGFDLAEVNIMQTCVDASESGKINAVEYSATQLGSLLPYIAGIFVNNPKLFPWLVVGSAASIFIAAVLFTAWSARKSAAFRDRLELLSAKKEPTDEAVSIQE